MTSSLLLLLPIGLAFVVLIGAFFWWAIFAGQFDEAQDRGESILQDDDRPQNPAAPEETDGRGH